MNSTPDIFPQVEVLPPEGDAAQPTEKGAVVRIGSQNRSRGRPQSSKSAVAPVENDAQKRAFAFYYSLGAERTLAKVAEMFGVVEGTVKNWSAVFGWKKRIDEYDSFSNLEYARRRWEQALKMKSDQLFTPDEDNPGKEKLSEYGTTNNIKELGGSINTAYDLRFKEQQANKGSGDPIKGPRGVMVNVIIKK